MIEKIKSLHAIYGQLTGLVIPLDMQRQSMWYEWQRRGHGEPELREVIAHLRRGIRDQKRNQGALKFRNLIGMPDYFEEDLAEARATRRAFQARPQVQLAGVLRSTGRPTEPKGEAKPVAKTIAEIAASSEFQKFQQFRQALNQGTHEKH